ncbi:hypothetical protein [Butyrivibrio sp. AE3004]|uniref:hypothetical protein n=1 Tax=Butyrivibrio sp. AE3004 TaxID=1506994 RepID=UPI000493E668|nr:hypothetical protein [Butyrivibrio sp. AE3004]
MSEIFKHKDKNKNINDPFDQENVIQTGNLQENYELKKRQKKNVLQFEEQQINDGQPEELQLTYLQQDGWHLREQISSNDDETMPFFITNDKEYLEQLLERSHEDNLTVKLKKEEMFDEGNWSEYSYVRGKFRQILSAAKNDKIAQKAEEKEKAKLKKRYGFADLCTVREYNSLKQYLENRQGNTQAMTEGKDESNDPALMAYVNSILSVEITEKTFTDEYLSNHIVTLCEYCQNIQKYMDIKAAYPMFFNNLPEDKKIILESRARVGKELSDLIFMHMKAHGIEIRKEKDRRPSADITENADKEMQIEAENKYTYNRDEFLENKYPMEHLNLSELFVNDNAFSSKKTIAKTIEKISAKECLGEEKTGLVQGSLGEMQRILKVRDEFCGKLPGLRGMYLTAKTTAEKSRIADKIARINRRIAFATVCADHYREYIDYILGEAKHISRETDEFIRKQTDRIRHAKAVEGDRIALKMQKQKSQGEDKRSEKTDTEKENEVNILAGILGVKGIYDNVDKNVATEGKGIIREGYVQNLPDIEQSQVRRGIRKINNIFGSAKKNGMDVIYPEGVLRKFSTLRIMDFLTGRDNRGDEDLTYNTEIKDYEGKKAVYISSVISINERLAFSRNTQTDPVAMGMVDKSSRFLFPYDVEFADRVMKIDPDTMLNKLIEKGAELDEAERKAFKQRYRKLQELFVKDLASGWRSRSSKENRNKTRQEDINDGYAEVDESLTN